MGAKSRKLIRQAREQDIRLAVVPIARLDDVRGSIHRMAETEELNGFQKWITSEGYVLSVPDLTFHPRSLIIAVWRHRLAWAVFTHQGRTVRCTMDDAYVDTPSERYLESLFQAEDVQVHFDFWLPHKRLANQAGLVTYGRNNITYAGDWGSTVRIKVYFSDLEPEEGVWRDVSCLERCASCGICEASCPTSALRADRFLVDTDRCVSFHNEQPTDPWPAWMPDTAHTRLVDCMRCQEICPENAGLLDDIPEVVRFTEEETQTILDGWNYEAYPNVLKKKLWFFRNPDADMRFIPRNLRAMLDNPELLEETDKKEKF